MWSLPILVLSDDIDVGEAVRWISVRMLWRQDTVELSPLGAIVITRVCLLVVLSSVVLAVILTPKSILSCLSFVPNVIINFLPLEA